MKKQLHLKLALLFVVICLSPSAVPCASAQSATQGARKFDEFGDILYSDLIARLDNFAMQLQTQPNTRGFIMIYRTRRDLPGLNVRLAGRIKNYLVYTRGIDANRVVMVDAGAATSMVQELWLVPIGAAPTPRDDVFTGQLTDPTTAWKYDEYYYPLPKDVMLYDYETDSLGGYAEALRKQPDSQAYVLVYPQYYPRAGRVDSPKTAARMMKGIRGQLVEKHGVEAARIKIVNGGYRKLRQVELWLVPPGEHPPIATPNAFPKRRR